MEIGQYLDDLRFSKEDFTCSKRPSEQDSYQGQGQGGRQQGVVEYSFDNIHSFKEHVSSAYLALGSNDGPEIDQNLKECTV